MPRRKFQKPSVRARNDVRHPWWYVQFYADVLTATGLKRERVTKRLGLCDQVKKGKADRDAAKLLATVNAGLFVLQAQIPFDEVLLRFEEIRLPQLGQATRLRYQSHIKNKIRPRFGALRMCDIGRAEVEAWLNEEAANGAAHNSLLNMRNLLCAIFSKAQAWGLWEGKNPVEKVRVGGKRNVRPKRLIADADLHAFLGAIKDTAIINAEGARLIVITALVTGLRISEVLGLCREDVDATAQTLTVRQRWSRGNLAEPKSAASCRTQACGPLAADLIAFAGGRDGFIFGRKSDAWTPPDDRDLQQHVFRPAAERAGIYAPGFGVHTFRSLNITWRQQAGASPFEAMKAAGHASLSMTYLYTRTNAERDRADVEAISARLKRPKGVDLESTEPTGGVM